MVEFARVINQSEINFSYLNLTDERGQKYGTGFPFPHRTKLAIIDGQGRVTTAKKHHENQIWGLNKWFASNGIRANTRISVSLNPDERKEGLPVVHLVPEGEVVSIGRRSDRDVASGDSPEVEPEIPLSLEKQLEDFLAGNLSMLEPGLGLYRDEDGREGKQYPTDVGVIDLLCSRPGGGLLVVELKRGRTSDVAVGQLSRYMGWVKKHIAGDAPVTGMILAHDRDDNLKYAVAAHSTISLCYFKLRLQIVSEEELE